MGLGRASPDLGLGMAIEVLGGDTGDVGNVVIVGQGLPREGFAPKMRDHPSIKLNQAAPTGLKAC